MDPIPSYDLIQAVDPTKIKIPISDRFAKLTLSSNKKRRQQQQNKSDHEDDLRELQEKRESISRNISKQFDNDNENKAKTATGQNPLLRSESSKESERNNIETETTMEPLEVSQDFDNPTQVEEDVDLLSQKIASLEVCSRPISSSDSIENTQLVYNTSEANSIHIVRNIPINVREAAKQDTILLNLTNSANESLQNYEMTDDEDDYEMLSNGKEVKDDNEDEEDEDEDEDEDEVITVSDTSESHNEHDVMSTSNNQTDNLSLPSLADDKAERVAAFLRDVSLERRAMIEEGHVEYNDTIDRILDNEDIDKIQEAMTKSRQIATADTESVTPEVNEEVTPKSLIEREDRLKALERNNSDLLTESEERLERSHYLKDKKNVKCLANDETQDNTIMTESNDELELDIDRTLKSVPNFKSDCPYSISVHSKTHDEDAYKIVNDETECNSESLVLDVNTPKLHSKYKMSETENQDNSRRLADRETEEKTEISLAENDSLTINKRTESDPYRLANDDTMPNSAMTDLNKVDSPIQYNYSKDFKTPQKAGSNSTESNETDGNCSLYRHSTSQSLDVESFTYDMNSSIERNVTGPEDSITILETDDENVEEIPPAKNVQSDDDKKLSNSFHSKADSSDDSDYNEKMSQIQMSMSSINISAKIKIRIHIPNTSTETSEDDQNYECETHKDNEERIEQKITQESPTMTDKEPEVLQENDLNTESNATEVLLLKPSNQMQLKPPAAEILNTSDESSDSGEIVEDKKFLTEAEKLLTQLYGESWQTPDVIRTLKRTSKSSNKKSNAKNSPRKDCISTSKDVSNNPTAEESVLHDFSIFRRNIVKTNLDSTRLATPKTQLHNKKISTEPRHARKAMTETGKTVANKAIPQTERKPLGPPVAKIVINKDRTNDDRWRQLVDNDSDSDGNNASDDDDADESWSKNASEIETNISSSDAEYSPKPKARNRRANTTKLMGRSIKSDYLTKKLNTSKDDELVYLDLSKEEVEVQDNVPESPPANHDVTFASRLQDILKSCRHEDKAKLPSTAKKTKRKLFTPKFGDDDYEGALLTEDDKSKENVATNVFNKYSIEDEIVQDFDNCPFDSQGRSRVLDVVNKKLESVKTGKPIFQLTPSPKRKETTPPWTAKSDKSTKSGGDTPKGRTDGDVKFKTPSTIKSKGPARALKDLTQTPEYKYSFLKSLDVTVSRSFCHPDGLYYRDNYRTKKEDLSKILYDMYNEKLFRNKLNVPVTWNKKLSNTAGRCLNKKKFGNRLSVIELSDKVLTSADRLRCTLIHELCHAATWIFNGEGGHGSTWKEWARKANATFPEIPKIGVCHQYEIEYKYTYKCTLCAAKSYAHSKSKKVENIRCSYCHGAIEIFLNKKDKDGNIMPTPVREPTGFAKFVKDNYKKFKREDLKHADVMKLLSSEFASLKVAIN